MIRSLSIELKIIIGIILFTILIVSAERYQLSDNIVNQFIKSKKSKNNLLIDTISPIIALNISLGLEDANEEYLNQIVKQNDDLEFLELKNVNKDIIYTYIKESTKHLKKEEGDTNFCSKNIIDPISGENFGFIDLYFSDKELIEVHQKNTDTTISIFLITFILLFLFIFLIKRELKDLKVLSRDVLAYDPKLNNLSLRESKRSDEIGVIHNAIMSMVERIDLHSKDLDAINHSLEDKVKERTKELEAVNEKLKALSITDALTQLYNRRYFEQHLKDTWDMAQRKNVDMSIIMCDIDYFKHVNDTYGHAAGDIVLKIVANVMKTSIKRSTDFVARYGGEEFIIVLYDTNTNGAHELCTTIQKGIKSLGNFEAHGIKIRPITMSFGVSSIIPDTGNIPSNLVKSADFALYQAKQSGRDRIIIDD